MESIDWATMAMLLAGITVAGAVSGLLAGVFGIGGGVITVPVFYEVFGLIGIDDVVRMHLAVGSSLGIIVPTGIRSFFAHKASGRVDMPLLRSWVLAIFCGVAGAAIVAAYIDGRGLRIIFAVVALLVAIRMLFGFAWLRLGDDMPGFPLRALYGAGIGFFSTLMGIGGGVLCNTIMTLYNRSMHQAVATSSGVGVLIAVPATVGMMIAGYGRAALPAFSIGFVNIVAVAMVVPLTILCAPFGARLAHALSRRHLEVGFGVFLLLVAGRYISSVV